MNTSATQRASLAVSVALADSGRVLLVRRGRPPAKDLYAFPGGRVEAGETLEQAARRELFEETGLSAGAMHEVATLLLEPEGDHGIAFELHVFGAKDPAGTLEAGDDAAEAAWFTLDEMKGLQLAGSVGEIAEEMVANGGDVGSRPPAE